MKKSNACWMLLKINHCGFIEYDLESHATSSSWGNAGTDVFQFKFISLNSLEAIKTMDKINKNFQFSWSLCKTYTDILTVVSLDPGDSLNQKQKPKTGIYLFYTSYYVGV